MRRSPHYGQPLFTGCAVVRKHDGNPPGCAAEPASAPLQRAWSAAQGRLPVAALILAALLALGSTSKAQEPALNAGSAAAASSAEPGPPQQFSPIPAISVAAVPVEGTFASQSETIQPVEPRTSPVPEKSIWADVPSLRPLPRIGWFSIAPSGPGYYSFRDWLSGRYRESPPSVPYPPYASNPITFFDADYRYLDDPQYSDRDVFDHLKRQHPTDNWMCSLGGEERVRSMNEVDSRLTTVHNQYMLTRSRLYADVWYRDQVRVYAEMQDSQSTAQALPPLKSDIDHADLLDLFADVKLTEVDDHPAYVRGGRQELYYGSQRLISSSDFPNVRRTFTGVKAFYCGEKWNLDAFWVQPVQMLPNEFDRPYNQQQFVGLWSNYRPVKGQQIDTYYLMLDNTSPTAATGSGGAEGGLVVNTVGARYAGDWHQLLWDFEGMYQFGTWSNQQDSAGATVAGLGYAFSQLPATPHFWTYYEWATGQTNPDGSVHRTFDQLFPWGHAYFGYLDLVGRQNIRDLNMQLTAYPTHWITPALQFHIFRLDSARDALYAANGTALRSDPSGAAGRDVGDEIDFTINFHLARHQEVFIGYSKLFAGYFIAQTGPNVSPEVTYVQYSFKW